MINKKNILLVFGTRPEAIKMAPLVHALKKESTVFNVQVCVTAQHRQMLDQVLATFNIQPDFDLNLMRAGQDLFDVTSSVLIGMRDVLRNVKPDILLVHGDTTTSFAASLAAFYEGILVGHIEAGLRTFNIRSPFPEEFNRQVTSKIAKFHFAPTILSKNNLLNENINNENIFVTGNTVIDALHWTLNEIDTNPHKNSTITNFFDSKLQFNWRKSRIVLITGHRRENFGEAFLEICTALKELANVYKNVDFVYPVHLNPNVQLPVRKILSDSSNIHLIDPLDYEPFIYLLRQSYIVLTDSGGIQEEAPSLGKPVLVMRETTERPEAVEAGTVLLVGANRDRIVSTMRNLLDDEQFYTSMATAHNPYGDGKACKRIVEALANA